MHWIVSTMVISAYCDITAQRRKELEEKNPFCPEAIQGRSDCCSPVVMYFSSSPSVIVKSVRYNK